MSNIYINENNAYITYSPQPSENESGQLSGLRAAIKDNICLEGMPLTCASKILSGYIPPYTATAARHIIDAGAQIIGKTNMDEFAMGSFGDTSFYGETKNPVFPGRSAGGTSSGSAAAVAEGSADFALGSDTGGSVRVPAAFCSLVALKPTYGAISRHGLVSYASSLDTVGIIARDVCTCGKVARVVYGRDEHDMTSVDVSPNCDSTGARAVIAAESDMCEYAAELFSDFSHLPREMLGFLGYSDVAYGIIATCEASSELARYDGIRYGAGGGELYFDARTDGFGCEVKDRILRGTFFLYGENYERYYLRALGARDKIQKRTDELFSHYDFIITPTTPVFPPIVGQTQGVKTDIFTSWVNLAGLPAITLPYMSASGLPMGLQIIGRKGEDMRLLDYAESIERSRG